MSRGDISRNKYATSGLGVKTKSDLDNINMFYNLVETLAEKFGIKSEEVLRKSKIKPHRTVLDPYQKKEEQIETLINAIRDSLSGSNSDYQVGY